MTATKITRTFKFNSIDLPDPDPDMTKEEVVAHYASAYPQMNNATVKDNGIEGEQHVFNISTSVGHNG